MQAHPTTRRQLRDRPLSHEAEDADSIPDELLCPELLLKPRPRSSDDDDAFGNGRELPWLFWARDQSRIQGKRSVKLENLDLLSISSRRKSFEDDSKDKAYGISGVRKGKDNRGSALAHSGCSEALGDIDKFSEGASASATSTDVPAEPMSCTRVSLWDGPCHKTMALAGFFRKSRDRAQCSYCGLELRNLKPTEDVWNRHKRLSPNCRRLQQVCDAGVHSSPGGKKQLRHSFSSLYDLTRP